MIRPRAGAGVAYQLLNAAYAASTASRAVSRVANSVVPMMSLIFAGLIFGTDFPEPDPTHLPLIKLR